MRISDWSSDVCSSDLDHGTVTFPKDARGADWPGDARVTFDAAANALAVRIAARAEGQLEALEGAVARHLDRFAFRAAPLTFDWQRLALRPACDSLAHCHLTGTSYLRAKIATIGKTPHAGRQGTTEQTLATQRHN